MCHVLIIEDEAMIAMAIEAVLEDAGAKSFDFADSEAEAVAAARAHRPDFISSDVALREGTGPSAVRTIHREMSEMPVIFLTGTPEDCDPCDPRGSIMGKPFDPGRLGRAFSEATRNAA